jgi:hypothetical protein
MAAKRAADRTTRAQRFMARRSMIWRLMTGSPIVSLNGLSDDAEAESAQKCASSMTKLAVTEGAGLGSGRPRSYVLFMYRETSPWPSRM